MAAKFKKSYMRNHKFEKGEIDIMRQGRIWRVSMILGRI